MIYDKFYIKVIYFFCFASYGVLYPFLPVFFESLLLSKTQIGILTMIPNFSSFCFGPIWSLICDKFHVHNEAMILSIIISTILLQSMCYMTSFISVCFTNLMAAFFRSPFTPLLDSFVISSLENKADYGSMRMWGAISFGIFSFAGGLATSVGTFTLSSSSSSNESNKNSNLLNDQNSVNHDQKDSQKSFSILFIIATLTSCLSGYIILMLVNRNIINQVHAHKQDQVPSQIVTSSSLTTQDPSSSSSYAHLPSNSTNDLDSDSNVHLSRNPSFESSRTVVINSIEESDRVHNASHIFDLQRQSMKMSIQHSADSTKPQIVFEISKQASDDTIHQNNEASLVIVLKSFISNNSVPIFAVIVLLSGIGAGIIDAFLFLRLKQLGGSRLAMGTARFITCAAEVPMFHVAGYLQATYGTWRVLAVTQFAFVIRFTYYSILVHPWWVLPCEVLHGLTFATMWSVSCTFASEVSPPGTEATVQAILESLHFGLGSGLGSLFGGMIYDNYGAIILFRGCAMMSTIATILAILKSIEVYTRESELLTLRKGANPLPLRETDGV